MRVSAFVLRATAVTAPLQIACAGIDADALLAGSPFGPFAPHTRAHLDDLAGADVDALLIAGAALERVAAWPALPAMAAQSAVLVLADDADPGHPATAAAMLQLMQMGVQDVLPQADVSAPVLARALRLAIERKRLDSATRRAFATDLSTGLPHHPQLLEHMSHLLALREREPAPMALIALRITGLAGTEALLGAESANVLRRKAAVRLRSALRASDVVASIGNDAFAVLLAWIDSPHDGERVAAKLAHALARPFNVAGREQVLGVSVGLASYPEHGKEADALMRRAIAQATQRVSGGVQGSHPGQSADRGPGAAANDG
jgi:diguanylate cyclase (GGDEF)-like protein